MKLQKVDRRVLGSERHEPVWLFLIWLILLAFAVGALVGLMMWHRSLYGLSLSVHQMIGPLSLLIIPVVFSILGLCAFEKGRRYVMLMQAYFYFAFCGMAFVATSILAVVNSPQYVDGGIGQSGGIISSYEAHLVLLLISFGMGILVYACGDLKIYRSIWKALAGICAVIGILLPSVLESHKVHWAEWKRLGRSYAERYEDLRFAISLGEIALGLSAAFVVVCIVSFVLVPKFADLSSSAVVIKKNSLWYDGCSLEFGGCENSVQNSVVHPGKDMSPIVKLGNVDTAGTFDEVTSSGGSSRSERSRFRARDLFVLGLLLVCGR
jgi:membrane protein